MGERSIETDMQTALEMVSGTVAELLSAGVEPCIVAAALHATCGAIYRGAFPDMATREKVIQHAAKCMLTGKGQPLP
jgi:hypothetical protein